MTIARQARLAWNALKTFARSTLNLLGLSDTALFEKTPLA